MHWFTLCDLFKDKIMLWLLFFLGPLPRSFFSILFEQECFKKGKSDWRKKQGICLGFPTFDPSQCQQQNKNPQHLDTFRSFWVVCARNSRTERTHTHSLSYTLHIFTPYICWIPLMKHECWDRVVASLKPVKGQIVDVQESRTLVTESYFIILRGCAEFKRWFACYSLAAWPCQPDIHETTNGLKAKTHDILSQFLIYVRLLF